MIQLWTWSLGDAKGGVWVCLKVVVACICRAYRFDDGKIA